MFQITARFHIQFPREVSREEAFAWTYEYTFFCFCFCIVMDIMIVSIIVINIIVNHTLSSITRDHGIIGRNTHINIITCILAIVILVTFIHLTLTHMT